MVTSPNDNAAAIALNRFGLGLARKTRRQLIPKPGCSRSSSSISRFLRRGRGSRPASR